MNEDLMRQFLGAALMCGETIKNKVDRENPDPIEIFLRDSGLDLFIDAVELGFIE